MISPEHEKKLVLIGKKIRHLRKQAGFSSYEDFAETYGFSRRNYWGMEKGKEFKITTLLAILDIHKISLKSFFKDLE